MFSTRESGARSQESGTSAGFTVIELLVTISIFSVVSVAVYSAFAGGISVWKRQNQINRTSTSSRILLEKFARDVRNMVSFSEITIVGSKNFVSFPALVTILSENSKVERHVGKITYFFDSYQKALFRNEEGYGASLQRTTMEGKEVLSSVSDIVFTYYIYNIESGEYIWMNQWDGEQESEQLFGMRVDVIYEGESGKEETLSKRIYLSKGRML